MSINKKKEVIDWAKSILVAVILAIIIKSFILQGTKIKGASMKPTLENNDMLFINKAIYIADKPNRGDIAILKAFDNPSKEYYIKRIIALEGETIKIIDGKIFIDGEKLKEKYLKEDTYTTTYKKCEWKIPKNHVFVLGDNRKVSYDSRIFGPVSVEIIKGKAFFRIYPFGDSFGGIYN
ncbi:MAG: signal peptidase I [Firmicutes bacterium]|nr:signal peptidase I [Bacillota bacterium]